MTTDNFHAGLEIELRFLNLTFRTMSSFTSASTRLQLARLRKEAPSELPMARLCADVIHAVLADDDQVMSETIVELKKKLGSNWTATHAFQFMSGRRGEFAADCGLPDEKLYLFRAHLAAKALCHEAGLGTVEKIDGIDLAKLRSLMA